MKKLLATLLLVAVFGAGAVTHAADTARNPRVRVITNMGEIELELFADKAPATVKNFLQYVDAGFYDGTIFHRVIPGFMIQGGGFTAFRQGAVYEMHERPARVPIKNEAGNGLKNLAGTLAMARTPDPHSASAQFFINTADNPPLDYRADTVEGWGYCVFGKVVKGMEVVKRIEALPTTTVGHLENVPTKDAVIGQMLRMTDR